MTLVSRVTINSDEELRSLVSSPSEPIVIEGLANNWPAVQAAKTSAHSALSYIQKFSNNMPVGIGSVDKIFEGRLFYNSDFSGFNFSRQNCPFPDFIELIIKSSQSDTLPDHYMGSTNVKQLLPLFKAENDVNALSELNPLTSIWISNKTTVAAHQDLPDNLAICVAGKRRFTLFPPDQLANLYVGPLDMTPAGQAISLVDHKSPDLQAHPNYATALEHAVTAELSPGDALIVPSLWWHSVESLEPINVLVNYWWQTTPAHIGSPMDALFHSIMNISQLSSQQKKSMQTLFNYYVFDEQQHSHIPDHIKGILDKDNELAVRKLRALLLNKLNQ